MRVSQAALVLVDLQNDFLPGGALGVPGADHVIPLANRLQANFDLVVATQDWHPPDHVSFAANHPGKHVGDVIDVDGRPQQLWPVHCVQHSHGAALATGLDTGRIAHRIYKGTNPRIDSYSGFFDNARQHSTGLNEYLRSKGVTKVYLAGLATDYCVKFTALDARQLGFDVVVLRDACRGIDAVAGDVERAIEEASAAGVKILLSDQLGC
ncbi:MAG TPA: bifunctional nicotinamidase/pyrazinamidase [Pirellulales bacterium]|nr:bifunctional nicotinamidase/pyrazinamidase [Pirellulales bacterium]